jgi:hypothetical protein
MTQRTRRLPASKKNTPTSKKNTGRNDWDGDRRLTAANRTSVMETLHEYPAWIAPREGAGHAAMDQSDHLLRFAYIAALATQQGTGRAADENG